jgi:hypothetical protein
LIKNAQNSAGAIDVAESVEFALRIIRNRFAIAPQISYDRNGEDIPVPEDAVARRLDLAFQEKAVARASPEPRVE